jgi:hypothetical protein
MLAFPAIPASVALVWNPGLFYAAFSRDRMVFAGCFLRIHFSRRELLEF